MKHWHGFIAGVLITGLFLFLIQSASLEPTVPSYSLSTENALMVIARPLPDDSTTGYYLANANFAGAFLENVNLRSSKLIVADFTGAILENANLRSADLSGAKLIKTDLRFADLSWTNLEGADLTDANLFFTDLSNANLDVATLTGADFGDARLEGAILPNGKQYKKGDDLIALFGAAVNPPQY
jgi:hypothetical protein